MTGADVTLIGTTAQVAATRIVRYIDTGTGTPTGTLINTAPAGHGLPRHRAVAAPVADGGGQRQGQRVVPAAAGTSAGRFCGR